MSQPLIEELVEELKPSPPPPSTAAGLLCWGLLSWFAVMALILWSGPLRSGALEQLLHIPRFLFECGLGVAVGLVAMAGALRIATPGRGPSVRVMLPGLMLLGFWIAVYAYGVVSPALAPSMDGYRGSCFLEVLLYSAPPFVLGLLLLRRRAPLEPGIAAGLAAVAAASLPGLAMQLACMYDPLHALGLHLSPMLIVGGVGALLGRAFLKRI